MSAEEQIHATASTGSEKTSDAADKVTETIIEQERSEKILKAKELYSHGSRNYLVKSYAEAADELSQVCALYEELYGELSDELGMPYLLYAKSLIALALDENKVIDVPDEESNDDDEDLDETDAEAGAVAEADVKDKATAASSTSNGAVTKLEPIKEYDNKEKSDEADSTADGGGVRQTENQEKETVSEKTNATNLEETQVSSTDDDKEIKKNGTGSGVKEEKPSTSNGDTNKGEEDEDDDNEAASNLQLAWEILELASKIFSRQGERGLPNLAEVQTELANIEFENNILDAAREDYVKALHIYGNLPLNYRRAMAEIHYKIGLTYLMQQLNKEGAESLKEACVLIDGEIKEIQTKPDFSDKDKNNIQDMEETKQEIWAKIAEIEEMQAQNIAEVRAALDSYIKPITNNVDNGPSSSAAVLNSGASSSSAISSSSKPTDISHLIKRKKPEEPSSEAEAAESPAKRPAV